MGRITTILGFIFGITGIGLLLSSAYMFYFTPIKQELMNLLPSENFEFIAFSPSQKEKTEYTYIQDKISFYTPKENETVVSYFNPEEKRSEFIIISKNTNINKTEKKQTQEDLLCLDVKKYTFCTSKTNTATLTKITNFIDNKNKSTKNLALLTTTQNISVADTLFFGTTNFFIRNISEENEEDIKRLLIFLQDTSPYFSGNCKENSISIQLHKTQENNKNNIDKKLYFTQKKPSNIYTIMSQENLINKDFLYISQPQKIIDMVTSNTISKNFVHQISEYKKFQDIFTDLFTNKISYFNDISPLLEGDVLITEPFTAITFANNTLAKNAYDKYYTLLKEISEETIPEKKCFTLDDQSQVCEIFPSEKNVKVVETSDYTQFITRDKNEEIISTKSIMIQDNIIFLSNSPTPYFDTISTPQNISSTPSVLSPFFIYKKNSVLISGKETADTIEFTGIFSN